MRKLSSLTVLLITTLITCLLPAVLYANTINLYESPSDSAKVTGKIDLSAGIVPIFTPKDSQWIKVADPTNGNTGWVKNSELKDSHGNIITFSQKVTEGNGNKTQSVEMSIGNSSLTPEQQAALKQQQKITEESINKAQQSVGQAMDAVKKVYQQTFKLMENAGFPKIPENNTTATPTNPNQAVPRSSTTTTTPTQ